MKIIIAGAGDVGYHLSKLLAFEDQDIILIDQNQEVLDHAATHLDVLTLKGDAATVSMLEQAGVSGAKLVLAVTTSEKTNLMVAILAKKLGAKQTIARVNKPEYFEPANRAFFQQLGIDSLIAPGYLAAKEIFRLVSQCSFTDVFEFEDGKMKLLGVTLEADSPLLNTPLSSSAFFETNKSLRPIAVLRGHTTIIPRGNTVLLPNDHVYFITTYENTDEVTSLVGKKHAEIKRVMILGGSHIAEETAKLLEQKYRVTLVESNKERCRELATVLNDTLILNGEPSDIDLLVEEGLEMMDAFIALLPNSEANIIASLTAKNKGIFKTIALVNNKEYIHISQNIGVDTLINQQIIAANNIFRYVRKGNVEAITSLHGVDAEVIEFSIHKENQLTKKPLKELHFPSTALIGGVIRDGKSLIPNGDFVLNVNDKVIVFAMTEAIEKIETMFR